MATMLICTMAILLLTDDLDLIFFRDNAQAASVIPPHHDAPDIIVSDHGSFFLFWAEGKCLAFILYCDESSDKGTKYSDFFGGCIIDSKDQFALTQALEHKKSELNLKAETKWTKVTDNYLNKYIEMIDPFFDFVKAGKIKVRIMFRKTSDQNDLNLERTVDDKYFKLYYQFIKNAFGLRTIPEDLVDRISGVNYNNHRR